MKYSHTFMYYIIFCFRKS